MVSTRMRTYDQLDPDATLTRHTNIPSTLFERRRRWASLLRMHHYQPVIAEVLAQELPKYANSSTFLPTSLSAIMRECMLILASAPLIFATAVDGNLAHRFLVDVDLQREYAMIQERAHAQPSIYIHLLADDNGVAPSTRQYMLIRDTVLKYIDPRNTDNELAGLVDNMTPPTVSRSSTASGYRKYLWTSGRSPHHEETLSRLCEGILKLWTEIPPSEHDKPLAFPPGECGYSLNSHIRLSQHRHRQSSNYVMNLVEDICSYLHRTKQLKQRFRMHQFIIYLIFQHQQAAIAEIFCSGLLQVWVEEGGGLNAYPAGRSVASSRRVSELEWTEYERWVSENTRLIENVKTQKERLESDVLEMDKEMEELWRDALGSDDGNDGDDEKDEDYLPDELSQEFSQLRLDP